MITQTFIENLQVHVAFLNSLLTSFNKEHVPNLSCTGKHCKASFATFIWMDKRDVLHLGPFFELVNHCVHL